MTNWDKFTNELNELVVEYDKIAVVDGKPCRCLDITKCAECDLLHMEGPESCERKLLKWFKEEYVEHCSFKEDELVEVSNNGIYWELRYFSCMRNNKYVCFPNQRHSNNIKPGGVAFTSWNYCRKYGTLSGLVKEQKNEQ